MHYYLKPKCIKMQKYIQSYVVLPSIIHTPLIIYKDVQYENQLNFMQQKQHKIQNQNQNQNIKN